jgi:hypothetical protein
MKKGQLGDGIYRGIRSISGKDRRKNFAAGAVGEKPYCIGVSD